VGPMGRPVLPLRTRLAAWLVTGPVGHLWAGIVDWLALLGRIAWARLRRREVQWWD
jgi:hypothetical protein